MWYNLCHNWPMWRVVVGERVMVGPCGDTLPPITTHHIGELWHKLWHLHCSLYFLPFEVSLTSMWLLTGTCIGSVENFEFLNKGWDECFRHKFFSALSLTCCNITCHKFLYYNVLATSSFQPLVLFEQKMLLVTPRPNFIIILCVLMVNYYFKPLSFYN